MTTFSSVPIAAFRFAVEKEAASRDIGVFQKDLNGLNKTSLNDLNLSIGGIAKSFSALVPAVSVVAVAGFIKTSISAALVMDDLAERAGITTSSFSKLAYAAEQSDLSTESLAKGFKAFQNILSEASRGTKSAVATFSELGINAADLKAQKPEEQLLAIADAFKKIADPADRTRLSIDLFSKSGTEFVPFLAQGSERIKELTDAAVALDDRATKALDRSAKAWDRLWSAIKNGTANLAGDIAFKLVGSGDALLDAQGKLQEAMDQRDRQLARGFPTDSIDAQIKALEKDIEKLQEVIRLQGIALNPKFASNHQKSGGSLLPDSVTVDLPAHHRQRRSDNVRDDLSNPFKELDEAPLLQLEKDLAAATIDVQKDLHAHLLESQSAFNSEMIRVNTEREDRISYSEQLTADIKLENTERYLAAKKVMEENAASAGIGLLQALAQRSRGAAIAMIAINKGLAVARAIQNTSVAATAALAVGDPYTAPARVAWIKGLGALEIATILGTGFIEAGNTGASYGGGGGSYPGGSGYGQGADARIGNDIDRNAAEARGAIQVFVEGDFLDTREGSRWLVDTIQDAFDRDVVMIKANSAQAKVFAPV